MAKVRHRLRRHERRASILDAATTLLATGGADSVSMEGVAEASGISRPVLYDHFPDRTALLISVYMDWAEYLLQHVRDAVAAAPKTVEGIVRASMRSYLTALKKRKSIVRVLVAAVPNDKKVEAVRMEVRRTWTQFYVDRFKDLTTLSSRTLASAVPVLLAMAEEIGAQCVAGHLSDERAEQIHVAMVTGAIDRLQKV